jgi:hypothetical protein
VGLDPDVAVGAPIAPITTEIPERETTRRTLALILLGMLLVEVLAGLAAAILDPFIRVEPGGKKMTDSIQIVLNIIFAPTIALVGAATGFYFGSNAGQEAAPRASDNS